jgi:hypothetical protein
MAINYGVRPILRSEIVMNRRILTLCKYLVATSMLFATAPAFSGVNDHPAFKFKSNKELANLKPTSKSQTPLSRVDQKPSVDELHYEEKHPHQDVTLVDTASIDTSKLIPSKVISLDPNRPDLELPDPQITIAGKTYILSVVESIPDAKEQVRYVTAKLIGHKGRARFIIDDESREVVGNLVIDGETYRVIPRELNKNQQLVYKLKQREPKSNNRSKARLISKGTHSSIHRLEKQLLKAELIQISRPVYYNETVRNAGRSANLIAEDIGQVDIKKILKKDILEISGLLHRLHLITNAPKNSQYEIRKITGNEKKGYSVKFRQVINDIPVKATSKIKISPEGQVTDLYTLVINPQLATIEPSKYSKEKALKLALAAVNLHLGKPDLQWVTLDKSPIELSYEIRGNEYSLVPYWEVVFYEVSQNLGAYRVFVEGHTGEAKVLEAGDRVTTDFKTNVCEHESGVSLPSCEDVNVVIPLWPPITIISDVREIISEASLVRRH